MAKLRINSCLVLLVIILSVLVMICLWLFVSDAADFMNSCIDGKVGQADVGDLSGLLGEVQWRTREWRETK